MLNYSVFKKNKTAVVKASGKICRAAVLSSGNFVRGLLEKGYADITLDIDSLDDEREMLYHIALINSFKKEVERAGGIFTLVSTRPAVKAYLSICGLERLFIYRKHDSMNRGGQNGVSRY